MPYTKDPAPIVRATSRPTSIGFRRDEENAVQIDLQFADLGISFTMPLSATTLTGTEKTSLGVLIDQIGADALAALGFTAS